MTLDEFLSKVPDKIKFLIITLYNDKLPVTKIRNKAFLFGETVALVLQNSGLRVKKSDLVHVKNRIKSSKTGLDDESLERRIFELSHKKIHDTRLHKIKRCDRDKANARCYIEGGQPQMSTMKYLSEGVISEKVFEYYVETGQIAFYKVYERSDISKKQKSEIHKEYKEIEDMMKAEYEFFQENTLDVVDGKIKAVKRSQNVFNTLGI